MRIRLPRIPVAVYAPAMAGLYRLWEASLRHEVQGWEAVARAKEQGRAVVFAHFHDETFCLPYLRRMGPYRFVAIVSQSQDGEIMAQLLQRLGLVTARGSKSRGGVQALILARKMMRREGRIGVVTVDGPRGPRHKVKEGAVYLAQKTGALLVPIRIGLSRKKIFARAWDRFQLPWPGARCRIVLGEPYELGETELDAATLQQEQERLETRMLALGERCAL